MQLLISIGSIGLILFITFIVTYLYYISQKIDILTDKLNKGSSLNSEAKDILESLRENNRRTKEIEKRFNELNQNIKSKTFKKNIALEVLLKEKEKQEETKNLII